MIRSSLVTKDKFCSVLEYRHDKIHPNWKKNRLEMFADDNEIDMINSQDFHTVETYLSFYDVTSDTNDSSTDPFVPFQSLFTFARRKRNIFSKI